MLSVLSLACGGESGDAGVSAASDITTGADGDGTNAPECASILGQSDAEYPARWSLGSAELEAFQAQSDAFRDHYGSTAQLYSIQPKGATASPDIARLSAGDESGIQLTGGTLREQEMISATDDFVDTWRALLDPYGVELRAQAATLDGSMYVQRDYLQSYCGLDVRYGDQHEYNGRLHFTAYQSNSTLLFAYSSLVPLLPLPEPILQPADVQRELIGQTLPLACGPRQSVADASCVRTAPREVVFVAPVGAALEYHLAYEAEVQLEPCAPGGRTWSVIVDAMDGALLHGTPEPGCPVE